MKKQNCRRIERLMLVLVSCVMIAVALLNLLHPVTAQAEQTALATGTDVQPTTEPKPIDEDAELYETYFLNLVDERDLLALLSDEELPSPTPEVIVVTPEPTAVPAATAAPADAATNKQSDSTRSLLLLAVIAVLGLGGTCVFLLLKQKKAAPQPSPEIYLEDEAEEEDEQPENTP